MAYTTIDDPSAHFQTTLWTGDGSSPRTITNDGNSNLQPDLVWHKNRSDSGRSHYLHDSSRGFGSEKELTANSNDIENSDNHLVENHGYIASVSTDSFVLGAGATNDVYTNRSSATYVAWQWKANGGSTTTNDASSTGVGNQDSVYQANTTAGFSIVTWTGSNANATLAHGLGAVPHFYLIKARTGTENWGVYHHKNTSAPETEYLNLNDNGATADHTILCNDTAPTSTVFTVADSGLANEVGKTYIGYLFSEIQGYSKFGSYTGNGNVDGTFVYTGFKPAFMIAKETGASRNWTMAASKMQTGANITNSFQPNTDASQDANERMDWLSNGFKLRTTSTTWNTDGGTYIYMAFAENPFVSSEGVPCTAR